jgi:DNA repair exonuclease SbcCD nuclease subunit
MKIGIITDTHYNFKKANKNFHEYFAKFYNEVFFPRLEKENIKTVIHMGDAFDNRKGIDYWALEWAKENVYDKFKDLGIKVYNVVGNHDVYYKNTNKINSVDLLLNEYKNVIPISSPLEVTFDGLNTLILPWICSENQEEIFNTLKDTDAKVIFGHLELNGFSVFPGQLQTGGMDKSIFDRFDRVYSGHYHTRSDDGKIFYLGNPYQMFWNDFGDTRGFHIFDTKNYKLNFIKNPYDIFEKIYYEDNSEDELIESNFENKIVKLVVRKNTNSKNFEKYVDTIIKFNPIDLKIVDTVDVDDSEVEYTDNEVENTLVILDKYIEDSDFSLDKNKVKNLIREVYKQALELE